MMRFVILLVALLVSHPAAAQSYGDVIDAVVANVILPAYTKHAETTAALAEAQRRVCEAEAELSDTQAAFRQAFLGWMSAEPIRIGPVMEDNLGQHIQFWPDKHGTAGRQLRRALMEEDEVLTVPISLKNQSVGLSSLTTLEEILFGNASERINQGDYVCDFAVAIAEHQAGLAGDLLEDWHAPDGFGETVRGARSGNDTYFSVFDPTSEIYRGLLDTLDVIIVLKLERPLGESLDRGRGRRAEAWRSGLSLDAIDANLATIRELILMDNGFAALQLAMRGDVNLDERMREQFNAVETAANVIDMPLAQAVEDPSARPGVEAFLEELRTLRRLLAIELGGAIGLGGGFNAADGD